MESVSFNLLFPIMLHMIHHQQQPSPSPTIREKIEPKLVMRERMFSAARHMQSAASTLFSAHTLFASSMMLIRSMANDLVPSPVQTYLQSALQYFFTPVLNQMTITVDEHCEGISRNQVYDAVEVCLRTKISPNTKHLNFGETPKR